jgi:hypothetical protein
MKGGGTHSYHCAVKDWCATVLPPQGSMCTMSDTGNNISTCTIMLKCAVTLLEPKMFII